MMKFSWRLVLGAPAARTFSLRRAQLRQRRQSMPGTDRAALPAPDAPGRAQNHFSFFASPAPCASS